MLSTIVWAWFEYQEPASQRPQSKSINSGRRNPVALALEWGQLLESGEIASRAELARKLGVTRAHVTQVLSLNHLAPEAREAVLSLEDPVTKRKLGIRTLRSISSLPKEEQLVWIQAYKAEAV